MRTTFAALLALAGSSHARPHTNSLKKRQTLATFNDVDILNYALTLEHLEDKFYREALANFTQADFASAGYDATFYTNLVEISEDETTHVTFLTGALSAAGATPVKECTYAFGITSVAAFVATASVFEGLGTSAYLGAAPQIVNKAYLGAAGSVLTIEARHSAYIRASLNQLPFPQPQEVPLTPNEVFTLASAFITACPADNPALPVKAFPALALTSTGTVSTGSQITVSTPKYVLKAADAEAHIYASFVSAGGPVWAPLTPVGNGVDYHVTIPAGVFGQSYLLFSNCDNVTALTDSQIVAGPAIVEITK